MPSACQTASTATPELMRGPKFYAKVFLVFSCVPDCTQTMLLPPPGMPLIGFGTSGIGDHETMLSSIRCALQTGYRLFDTAQFYQNEAHLGRALEELLLEMGLLRSDVWITTKIFDLCQVRSGRASLEDSLAQLRTDFVDLLLVHYPLYVSDPAGINEKKINDARRRQAWLEFEELKSAGLAKHIGVSNYEIKHLEEMKSYASIQPAVNQIEFHPHLVRPDLIDYCAKEGIHVTAHCSMGRQDPNLLNEPSLQSIAKSHNALPTQILLAFGLSCGFSVIPKSTQKGRIEENWNAQKISLSGEEIASLKTLDRHQNYTKCTPWLVE